MYDTKLSVNSGDCNNNENHIKKLIYIFFVRLQFHMLHAVIAFNSIEHERRTTHQMVGLCAVLSHALVSLSRPHTCLHLLFFRYLCSLMSIIHHSHSHHILFRKYECVCDFSMSVQHASMHTYNSSEMFNIKLCSHFCKIMRPNCNRFCPPPRSCIAHIQHTIVANLTPVNSKMKNTVAFCEN